MRFSNVLLASILTLSSTLAFAKTTLTAIEKKAALYMLSKTDPANMSYQSYNSNPGEVCYPVNSQDCIVFVAGSYPSQSEKIAAARACAGNVGTDCVKFAAGSYASFADKVAAAQACRNNVNSDCVQFVAGSYASTSEKATAAQACQNADVECVKYTAGSYASFADKVAAAKACSGQ